MATLLKVFLGLLVIVCLSQFIEMAPQAEDAAAESASKFLEQLSEQFKNALGDENLKKMVDGASTFFADTVKTLEPQMKNLQDSIAKIGEKQN